MSVLFSLWTVVAFVVFCGIVIWAWSARRKDEFGAAARMIFDADDERATRDG